MAHIKVGPNSHAIVDPEDAAKVSAFTWHVDKDGYAISRPRRRAVLMHRLVIDAAPELLVDHINGNRLDNRKSNLRLVTFTQNSQNRRLHPRSSSGFKGVYWARDQKSWRARITVDGQRKHLGYFSDPVKAALAYDEAAKIFFGEFAFINFPDIPGVAGELASISA